MSSAAAETVSDWKLPSKRKVGMACLIVTESALFTIFVVAYVYYIGKSLSGPFPKDVLHLPVLASICLFSSSFTIWLAEKALHAKNVGGFRLWWFITIFLGALFLGFTAQEWHELIFAEDPAKRLTISTNLFGSTFYALVGLHASHVIVGLTLLTLVLVFSLLNKIGPEQTERLEMVSWYWHFVDAIWIVVFLVVYVIGM